MFSLAKHQCTNIILPDLLLNEILTPLVSFVYKKCKNSITEAFITYEIVAPLTPSILFAIIILELRKTGSEIPLFSPSKETAQSAC